MKTILIIILAVLLFAALIASFLQRKKFLSKEREQEKRDIQTKQLINHLEHELTCVTNFKKTAFNYLAIGNSLTLQGKFEHWWDFVGMAASTREKDFVHQVAEHLKTKHKKVVFFPHNFSIWEMQSTDRARAICCLKKYLSEHIDLITLQLSENAADTETLAEDMKTLILILQQRCPRAKIIIVDDFWDDGRSQIKKQVAKELSLPFADLSEIRGPKEYMCGMGTIVYDEQGGAHKVDHEGVAAHPGDKGMQYIANSIINLL